MNPFGDPYEDYELTADIIMMWCRLALLMNEVPMLENYLDELEKSDIVDFDLIDFHTMNLQEAVDERENLSKLLIETSEK